MANKFCLNVNLSSFSLTQWCYWDFNSFCKIGDSSFAASEDGIFELKGDTDAGENIDSFFELILSDFGINNMKRIRSIYVGGEANGALTLSVKDDENNSRAYTLNLTSGNVQSSGKVSVGRNGIGRYWQIRIDNTGGAYFAIDDIEILAIILAQKPR
ncbi:MAG: hypothetical protein Q7J15_04160 [Candidatus Desulfaltia sp.]|nr:hypothetical protein [Candidatus Desulfaltia sp.]